MKLHPRYFVVKKAEFELSAFIMDLMNKHELTDGEIVKLLSGQLSTIAKYVIRSERHPDDPDKKGDEE